MIGRDQSSHHLVSGRKEGRKEGRLNEWLNNSIIIQNQNSRVAGGSRSVGTQTNVMVKQT